MSIFKFFIHRRYILHQKALAYVQNSWRIRLWEKTVRKRDFNRNSGNSRTEALMLCVLVQLDLNLATHVGDEGFCEYCRSRQLWQFGPGAIGVP